MVKIPMKKKTLDKILKKTLNPLRTGHSSFFLKNKNNTKKNWLFTDKIGTQRMKKKRKVRWKKQKGKSLWM